MATDAAANELTAEFLPPIVFPLATPTPGGDITEVAPGILWARLPLPIDLDHINVYLLRDDDGWFLIDTGLDTPTARALWGTLLRERLGGLPVKGVICTHWHYDHTGLAHWLTAQHDVPLYMTHGEYYMMHVLNQAPPAELPRAQAEFFERAGMPDELMRRMMDTLRQNPFISPMPMAFRRLRDGEAMAIGGRRWQVMIGEGHSPEHACLYCTEDGILIAGDQLLPRITSNVNVMAMEPEADPLQLWFDSLDRLSGLAPGTLVLPSHERAFTGLHARVTELREHHAHKLEVLRRHLANRGHCTAFEAAEALFPGPHGAADYWLVLGETIAHLSWLRFHANLVRELDGDTYRFRLGGP